MISYITLDEYDYNENSLVSQERIGGDLKNNFYYTNRNWISAMQNTEGMLEYTNEYFKNGNVKKQLISGDYNNNFTNSFDLPFNYTYDKSNRLLNTTRITGKSYEMSNTYDKDGNILTLQRYDGNSTLSDNFSYSYYSGTNKLRKVSGSTDQYTYDLNGNMTKDDLNGNSNIKYDHRNLITELRQEVGSKYKNTFYKYDEAGNRISKTVYEYQGSSILQDTTSESDFPNSSDWQLYNKEVYSRDVSGRELGTCQ
ncbi:MAG: hypothetical protein SGI89_14870 [bacterium]|nr:hypothetical protein [bacterium]